MNDSTEIIPISELLHSNNHNGNNDSNRNDSSVIVTDTTTDFVTATLIVDCRCELGEGIIYDDRIHTVLWTDILKRQFHTLQLQFDDCSTTTTAANTAGSSHSPTISTTTINHLTAIHTVYDVPKMIGSFGLIEHQNELRAKITTAKGKLESMPLLVAWEDGFQLYDVIQNVPLSSMSIGENVNPMKLPSRLNDGRVDPFGNYYVCGGFNGLLTIQTKGEDGEQIVEPVSMKVYKVEQKMNEATLNDDNETRYNRYVLHHEPIVDKIRTTNSICWSTDGTLLYLADSPTKQICSYHYNKENGTIDPTSKTVVHAKLPLPEADVPDGSCVDEDGCIWNAVWCSGKKSSYVQRIDPNNGGHVVYTVHIPHRTSQITCCCFGGPNLNILFISTACEGTTVEMEPHAGGIYAVQVPFRGKKESKLRYHI